MYTPIIDVIKREKIKRIELKTQTTLKAKAAVEAREQYFKRFLAKHDFFKKQIQ